MIHLTIPVIAEHRDFLVVDKPCGITVQRDGERPGVLALLQASRGEDLWPVHRLDAPTSGLLLLARHADAAAALSGFFQRREIRKAYLGVSARMPSKKQGVVRGDMAPARRGQWKLLHTQTDPAITRFFTRGLGGTRLILALPETGRTHQIRVALRSLGAPLLGDDRYGGAPHPRLCLHAHGLAFELAGETHAFTCWPTLQDGFAPLADSSHREWVDALRMRQWEIPMPSDGETGGI